MRRPVSVAIIVIVVVATVGSAEALFVQLQRNEALQGGGALPGCLRPQAPPRTERRSRVHRVARQLGDRVETGRRQGGLWRMVRVWGWKQW